MSDFYVRVSGSDTPPHSWVDVAKIPRRSRWQRFRADYRFWRSEGFGVLSSVLEALRVTA